MPDHKLTTTHSFTSTPRTLLYHAPKPPLVFRYPLQKCGSASWPAEHPFSLDFLQCHRSEELVKPPCLQTWYVKLDPF